MQVSPGEVRGLQVSPGEGLAGEPRGGEPRGRHAGRPRGGACRYARRHAGKPRGRHGRVSARTRAYAHLYPLFRWVNCLGGYTV